MPGPMGSDGLVVDVESDSKAVATRSPGLAHAGPWEATIFAVPDRLNALPATGSCSSSRLAARRHAPDEEHDLESNKYAHYYSYSHSTF